MTNRKSKRRNTMASTSRHTINPGAKSAGINPSRCNPNEIKLNQSTVYVLDRNGVIIDTNEVMSPLTGHPPEQLLGRRLGDYLDPESRHALLTFCERPDSIDPLILKALIRNCKGMELPVRGEVFTLHDDLGRSMGFVVRLVPGEPNSDPAVRPSSDESLLELVSEAAFEADLNLKITYINGVVMKLFDYSRHDFEKGLTLAQMFAPEDEDKCIAYIKKVLAGEQHSAREFHFQRRDRTGFLGEVRVNLIREDDRISGIRGIIRDLTDQKEVAYETNTLIAFMSANLCVLEEYRHFLTDYMELCDRCLVELESADQRKLNEHINVLRILRRRMENERVIFKSLNGCQGKADRRDSLAISL